ncbi:hypothetical protein D7004_16445 [Pedobacter jejuensis]|uniref:Uncharacterized protein n=1 Tax=Pedobacter jejuensis TaxID=1268550 RepID=A0A3N0BQN2_9SPHI|nr:hypothetical protein D7004_16445 [Pedobacter jejuensis]
MTGVLVNFEKEFVNFHKKKDNAYAIKMLKQVQHDECISEFRKRICKFSQKKRIMLVLLRC